MYWLVMPDAASVTCEGMNNQNVGVILLLTFAQFTVGHDPRGQS